MANSEPYCNTHNAFGHVCCTPVYTLLMSNLPPAPVGTTTFAMGMLTYGTIDADDDDGTAGVVAVVR